MILSTVIVRVVPRRKITRVVGQKRPQIPMVRAEEVGEVLVVAKDLVAIIGVKVSIVWMTLVQGVPKVNNTTKMHQLTRRSFNRSKVRCKNQ